MKPAHALVAAVAMSIPTVAGLGLSAPAAADDLGQQVCSLIGKEGANLRGFLTINVALQRNGVRNPDTVIHQSVANTCPQYQAALVNADREAAGVNGGIMNCPPGKTYVPSLGRCRDY